MDKPSPSEPQGGILVVDNTLATLQILGSILTEAGYHVRTATDGNLALRSIQSQPPDLILLDIRMPEPDGFEVCRRLKADEYTRPIPVIFTTWLDEARDKVRGFELGAVDYITKPFDNHEVLARVSMHLTLRHTQQALQQTNQRLMAEISERERVEATLREILENTFDAAYRRNLKSNSYDYVSPAFIRISGYAPAETSALSATAVLDWIHPEDAPAVEQTIAACLAHPGELGQVDYRLRHKDGHYCWVQDRFTVVADAHGQPASLVGNCRDITERKQAEAALRDLYESLEQRIQERTAQLEESNRELRAEVAARQQSELALRASEARYRELAEENARLLDQSQKDAETKAILLHEVNHRVKNNLAAIVGLLQLELRYLSVEAQTPYLSLVEDLTSRIQSLALVHNLLSASQWAPLSLEKLAENVMQIAPVMLSRLQAVQMDIAPTPVLLNPKQASAVGLILNELATNSLKHGLRAHEPVCLSLQTSCSGDEVMLEYRDNGPGYPEEILQGARQSVGLYLLEALVEHDLNGQIALSNDHGAVVQLRFALAGDVQPVSPPIIR
jgi:PAS domain S-box-containing protein